MCFLFNFFFQVGDVLCDSSKLIDPFRIQDKEYTKAVTEENFRGTNNLVGLFKTASNTAQLLRLTSPPTRRHAWLGEHP